MLSVTSGPSWEVTRDGGAAQLVGLFRSQWLDPAWSYLWRRPHPLPEAAWLDGTPPHGVVVPTIPDTFAGRTQVEWFSWQLPPGVHEIHLPVASTMQVWINGEEQKIDSGTVYVSSSNQVESRITIRVIPERGRTGGGVFTGPVTYVTESGLIGLGDWKDHGLPAYSGGIRYQTTFTLDNIGGHLSLDLGKVRGTAEVWINGRNAGVRVWSPYQFDVTSLCQQGQNEVEILVLNTLAPYLDAVSPTHYVRPGQTVSGLFGPVRLYKELL